MGRNNGHPAPVPAPKRMCGADYATEDLGEFMRHLDALAQSSNPHDAAMGRVLKTVYPAFDGAVRAEADRGTDSHAVYGAFVSLLVSLVRRAAGSTAKDGERGTVMRMLAHDIALNVTNWTKDD